MVLSTRGKSRIVLAGILIAALFAQMFAVRQAHAQIYNTVSVTWTGLSTSSNSWSDPNNWVDGITPTMAFSGTVDTELEIIFPTGVSSGNKDSNNNLSLSGWIVLTIEDSGYSLTGNQLTVGMIDANYTSGSSAIALPISIYPLLMQFDLFVSTAAGGSLTLAGSISGGGGVGYYGDYMLGSGEVVLISSGSTVNTYTGITTIGYDSRVIVYLDTAFGASTPGNNYTEIYGTLELWASIDEDLQVFNASIQGGGDPDPVEMLGTITLVGDLEFSPSYSLSVGGVIDGTGNISLNGGGTVSFAGASSNVYDGDTVVDWGTLQLDKTGGAVAVPGNIEIYTDGTVQLLESEQIPNTNDIYIHTGGTLDVEAATETIDLLELYNGTVEGTTGIINPASIQTYAHSLSSLISSKLGLGTTSRSINVQNGTATTDLLISGQISSGSGGGITKIGAGMIEISDGTNSFSGGVVVDGGNLRVTNATGSATGTGSVTVNAGTTLSGTGRISGNVTIENDGTIAPGAPSGLLRVGNLTLKGQSKLAFRLGTPNLGFDNGGNNDYLKVNGNLTLNGDLNLTSTTGFGNGVYTLINYTGTLTNNGLVVGSAPSGHSYAVGTGTAGLVKLTVS